MAEPTKLGRYELRRVLGRGAMGVVYEGLDPSLNRRVAVKTILKNAAIDDETARAYSAQFAREAQAAGRLNHPNIVQVHDFAEQGEVAYLVMEYIQGRELRSYFDGKEKFEPAEAVRIMGELLDALDFAHEAGVIHRDVKPANVMLDAQRRVKLADFGVARIQDSERSAAGTMVGTPAFMSPEQIQGGKIDRRTDLFSAGVVLYQLLTGEQPFTGQGAWTVAKKIMQDDPPAPSAVVKSVSPVFDEIVSKALAKNPAQRFATAREFAAALRGALAPSAQTAPPGTTSLPLKPKAAGPAAKATEAEVEFWRAIQNSSDPDEIEFYLEQFPDGTYSQLARHKIAKLREPAEAARKETEEKARAEAEEQARRAAAARVQQEAEEKAKREAVAAAEARREAEERAKLAAVEKARRDADEKAKREAQEKVQREVLDKARREAEEKARQAHALARLKQLEEKAAREKQAAADEDATVAIGSARTPPPEPAVIPVPQKKSLAIPVIAGGVMVVAGIVAYLVLGRTPAPAPAPVAVAPAPSATPAVDEAKIRRELEERIRREFTEKAAVEKAQMEKAVAEKAAVEKAAAEKLAAAKTGAEKEAAEKAAQKATADRVAAEKAASDKAAAAKLAADKAMLAEKALADKAASEKAAADKLAADKAAAEKAAAEKTVVASVAPSPALARKPGWPMEGDRWTYDVRTVQGAGAPYQIAIEVMAVGASGISERQRNSDGGTPSHLHLASPVASGIRPGVINFQPYLRAFQEPRIGLVWPSVELVRFDGCGPKSSATCRASARISGKERVTVKAGTYDAWVVQLDIEISNPGASKLRQATYWYSDDALRFVKYQMRTRRGRSGAPEIDMELISYTPAGGR